LATSAAALPRSAFAIPERREFPVFDAAQARDSLALAASGGTPEEIQRVRESVADRLPSLVTNPDTPTCSTCGRPVGAPYRRYGPSGRVLEGCVDAFHSGNLLRDSKSAKFHARQEARAIRGETENPKTMPPVSGPASGTVASKPTSSAMTAMPPAAAGTSPAIPATAAATPPVSVDVGEKPVTELLEGDDAYREYMKVGQAELARFWRDDLADDLATKTADGTAAAGVEQEAQATPSAADVEHDGGAAENPASQKSGDVVVLAALGLGALFLFNQATTCGTKVQELLFPNNNKCARGSGGSGGDGGSGGRSTPPNAPPSGVPTAQRQTGWSGSPANGACGSQGKLYSDQNDAQNVYNKAGGGGFVPGQSFVAGCPSGGFIVLVNGNWQ